MKKPFHKSHGFSLIEVLVTLLLVSIGIIGLVAMQARAIQYTQDSVQRNHAAMLASDLFELIKANPTQIDTYSFSSLPAAASSATECIGLANTAASKQLECWSRDVRALLPGAADLVNNFHTCLSKTPGSCNAGSVLEIQLAWRAQGEGCLDDTVVAEETPSADDESTSEESSDDESGEGSEDEESADENAPPADTSICHYRIRAEV
ncbi:type IV pilus modification protein PilV [Pseudomonas sp.]|uniref:type IV pilus modification protein PilV n=1 Tax=Pseudomonas sp. TaxID=306 RepID=UPI0019FE4E75|nr:type IV pilus modification protein PilV [Pseudomonas sp.]